MFFFQPSLPSQCVLVLPSRPSYWVLVLLSPPLPLPSPHLYLETLGVPLLSNSMWDAPPLGGQRDVFREGRKNYQKILKIVFRLISMENHFFS